MGLLGERGLMLVRLIGQLDLMLVLLIGKASFVLVGLLGCRDAVRMFLPLKAHFLADFGLTELGLMLSQGHLVLGRLSAGVNLLLLMLHGHGVLLALHAKLNKG